MAETEAQPLTVSKKQKTRRLTQEGGRDRIVLGTERSRGAALEAERDTQPLAFRKATQQNAQKGQSSASKQESTIEKQSCRKLRVAQLV